MKFVKKFQNGGAVPQGAEQDPQAVLMQGAQQAVQNQDCQIAIQVCQMVLEMLGGGGGEAPAAAPEQASAEPVYRCGGRLVRRIQK